MPTPARQRKTKKRLVTTALGGGQNRRNAEAAKDDRKGRPDVRTKSGAKEWMNVCPGRRQLLLVRRSGYITSSDCMRRGGCGMRKRSGKEMEAWKACGRS
jgi:hypothetical protein